MKRFLNYALLIVLFVALYSCIDEIGKWRDNIKLSTKSVTFSSTADSVTIKTGGSSWWLTDVTVNNDHFYGFKEVNVEADSYKIQQECFVVERRDKHTLFIRIDANPDNVQRIITVGLEAGDYFDRVTITQKPKP